MKLSALLLIDPEESPLLDEEPLALFPHLNLYLGKAAFRRQAEDLIAAARNDRPDPEDR